MTRLKCFRLTGLISLAFLLVAVSTAPASAQPAPGRGRGPAIDQPAPRTDQNSQLAHTQLLEKAKKGGIDVYFEGDSITRRWGATDYPQFLDNWKQNFFGWNAADFGWGADRIQNILWRLENGELDNVNPKVIVLLAGTNNVGGSPPGGTMTRESRTSQRHKPFWISARRRRRRHDHRHGHHAPQRQPRQAHRRHARDQQDQREPCQARRWQEDPVPQHQRQAGRQGWHTVRRHDGRQAASCRSKATRSGPTP